MEIQNIDGFLNYLQRIHERTVRVVKSIPPDQIEWTPREGKFTLGDLVRHMAAIERYMYGENFQFKPSRYPGHGRDLADGYENVIAFLERAHQETVEILERLSPDDLNRKCVTPDGASITLWKWARAMVEHEIHHRGEIYCYLGLLGVTTPPLYGLTSEEVRDRSVTVGE